MTRGLLNDRDELESLSASSPMSSPGSVPLLTSSWWAVPGCSGTRNERRPVTSIRLAASTPTSAPPSIESERHDLRQGWLNDAAAAFWPSGAGYGDCEVVYEHAALVVRTPGPEVIFVMKLYRADPQDREDLIRLWPLCSFTGPEEAVDAFTGAYPHAPEDEYLGSYIADVARDAGQQ
jgi:hypothetical protein